MNTRPAFRPACDVALALAWALMAWLSIVVCSSESDSFRLIIWSILFNNFASAACDMAKDHAK